MSEPHEDNFRQKIKRKKKFEKKRNPTVVPLKNRSGGGAHTSKPKRLTKRDLEKYIEDSDTNDR